MNRTCRVPVMAIPFTPSRRPESIPTAGRSLFRAQATPVFPPVRRLAHNLAITGPEWPAKAGRGAPGGCELHPPRRADQRWLAPGVIAIAYGPSPTSIGVPAVLVAVAI